MLDCSKIRGFNYQPSRGTTSLENWVYFDPELYELELRRGKEYFPGFNTVRYWLSWDAYVRDPKGFKEKFESSLVIAERLDLKVVACLFNRWHDTLGYDNGGVYLENIIFPKAWAYYRSEFNQYVEDIVGAHVRDERILIWDICNEPFSYTAPLDDESKSFLPREQEWLAESYALVKKHDASTPAGVSMHNAFGPKGLDLVRDISDILLIRPYFICTDETLHDQALRAAHQKDLQDYADYAKAAGKQILVTEACWGALSDESRVEIVRFTLDTLKKHNLGFLAHALHYSRVADLHYAEDGFVGSPGNLAFTNKDGTLRKGHQIFNDY